MMDSSIARGIGIAVASIVATLWVTDYDFSIGFDYDFSIETLYVLVAVIAIAVIVIDWSIKFDTKSKPAKTNAKSGSNGAPPKINPQGAQGTHTRY